MNFMMRVTLSVVLKITPPPKKNWCLTTLCSEHVLLYNELYPLFIGHVNWACWAKNIKKNCLSIFFSLPTFNIFFCRKKQPHNLVFLNKFSLPSRNHSTLLHVRCTHIYSSVNWSFAKTPLLLFLHPTSHAALITSWSHTVTNKLHCGAKRKLTTCQQTRQSWLLYEWNKPNMTNLVIL